MSVHETNPAGRLWLFCEVAMNTKGKMMLRPLWESYFKTKDPATYLQRMGDIAALPQQIREAVELLENPVVPKDELVESLPRIEEYLHADFNGNQTVEWFQNGVGAANILSLRNCSYHLARDRPRPEVPQDKIDEIRSMADHLARLVANAEGLENDVRETISEYAHRLIRACDSYKINGPDALIDELNRFVGKLATSNIKHRMPSDLWEGVKTVSGLLVLAVSLYVAPADVIERQPPTSRFSNYLQELKLPARLSSNPNRTFRNSFSHPVP